MCILFSLVSLPLWLGLIYLRDVRAYTSPRKVAPPPPPPRKVSPEGVLAEVETADDAEPAKRPIDWYVACRPSHALHEHDMGMP